MTGTAAAVTITGTGQYSWAVTNLGVPTFTAGGSSATAIQDLLTVTGTLATAGSKVNITTTSIFSFGSAPFSWDIATASAGITGTPTLGTVGGSFAPFAANFSLTTNASNLFLNYTPVSVVWSGTASSLWTTGGSGGNWSNSPVPVSGQLAMFNNAGNGNTTINLGGIAQPIGSLGFDTAKIRSLTIGAGGIGSGNRTRRSTTTGPYSRPRR